MDDDNTDPENVLLVLMERAFRGAEYENAQTKDWQPHMKRVLQCVRENDPMVHELRRVIATLEYKLNFEIKRTNHIHTPDCYARGCNLGQRTAELTDKAIRFYLDVAGIESRERDAVELVELRAELAEARREAERLHEWADAILRYTSEGKENAIAAVVAEITTYAIKRKAAIDAAGFSGREPRRGSTERLSESPTRETR